MRILMIAGFMLRRNRALQPLPERLLPGQRDLQAQTVSVRAVPEGLPQEGHLGRAVRQAQALVDWAVGDDAHRTGCAEGVSILSNGKR